MGVKKRNLVGALGFLTLLIGLLFLAAHSSLSALMQLAGFDHPKEYIVLFQNNMELRATGGFLGSFGRIRVDKGKLSLVKIEDIYVPDGQLEGHVDPPWPIQSAFGQGWWKLRDSNFDPDFPQAAKNINWFFEQGKEPKADGLITVNLSLLEGLLKITGPVYLVDEPEKIDVQNFYKKIQSAVESNFFPGSNAKGDFLSKLGRSVFAALTQLPWWRKLELPMLALELLKTNQIFIYSPNTALENWLQTMHVDGSIQSIAGKQSDYLAFFESNFGSNKANCCINREVMLTVRAVNGSTNHELTLSYENTNPTMLKIPPQYWGGAYVNFLRIGIPIQAQVSLLRVGNVTFPVPQGNLDLKDTLVDLRNVNASSDPARLQVDIDARPDKGIKFIGFFVLVDALNSNTVRLSYTLPGIKNQLLIQKQSGIISYPLKIEAGKEQRSISVTSDLVLPYQL